MDRPVIFESRHVASYVDKMLRFRSGVDKNFSIRKEVEGIEGMSPALVTQLRSGRRRIRRDHLVALKKLLNLNSKEAEFLDQYLTAESQGQPVQRVTLPTVRSNSKNHLFSDWVHPFVKEAVRLRGFRNDAFSLYHLLGGMVPLPRIKRSLAFLIREGFLRKDQNGRIVQNSEYDESSDEIPSTKIRQFHQRSLRIAAEALSKFPVQKREAYTLVLPLDEEGAAELKAIMKEFRERLVQFVNERPKDRGRLYQVILNCCPLGGEGIHGKK